MMTIEEDHRWTAWNGEYAKPRLRWRHRGVIGGVVLDDWLVQRAGDISKPPLLAVYPHGYRLTESEILEYIGQ
jgi:hypothetical protein